MYPGKLLCNLVAAGSLIGGLLFSVPSCIAGSFVDSISSGGTSRGISGGGWFVGLVVFFVSLGISVLFARIARRINW